MTRDVLRLQALILNAYIRDKIDAELADLFEKYTRGDKSVVPQLHDRLNVVGWPDMADRLLKLEGIDR